MCSSLSVVSIELDVVDSIDEDRSSDDVIKEPKIVISAAIEVSNVGSVTNSVVFMYSETNSDDAGCEVIDCVVKMNSAVCVVCSSLDTVVLKYADV